MRSPVPPAEADVRATLRGWLARPRYEVLPTPDVPEEVAGLPGPAADYTVTVTASTARGQDVTLDLCDTLAALGVRVVPHLAARQLRDEVQLKEIVDRLGATGVTEVFAIAGDVDRPRGSFDGAVALARKLAELAPELDIGVAAYPESHPRIPDAVVRQALWDKAGYAAHAITQICFDAGTTTAWLAQRRERGFELPVLAGVPGPVPTGRLVRIATRIGVGSSLRFLLGHASMARLIRPGAYDPLPLLTALAAAETGRPGGVHLYTFNAVTATDAWRRRVLDALEQADDPATKAG